MTLDEDFQNVFRREGIEEGIQIGYQKGVDDEKVNSSANAIMFLVSEMNLSVDEAFSRYPIPDKYMETVEAEVRRRLEVSCD